MALFEPFVDSDISKSGIGSGADDDDEIVRDSDDTGEYDDDKSEDDDRLSKLAVTLNRTSTAYGVWVAKEQIQMQATETRLLTLLKNGVKSGKGGNGAVADLAARLQTRMTVVTRLLARFQMRTNDVVKDVEEGKVRDADDLRIRRDPLTQDSTAYAGLEGGR